MTSLVSSVRYLHPDHDGQQDQLSVWAPVWPSCGALPGESQTRSTPFRLGSAGAGSPLRDLQALSSSPPAAPHFPSLPYLKFLCPRVELPKVLRNGSKATDLPATKEERGVTQDSSPLLWRIHLPFTDGGEDEDRASAQAGIAVHRVHVRAHSFPSVLCSYGLGSLSAPAVTGLGLLLSGSGLAQNLAHSRCSINNSFFFRFGPELSLAILAPQSSPSGALGLHLPCLASPHAHWTW